MLDLSKLDKDSIRNLTEDDFRSVLGQVLDAQQDDAKETQILYYKAASKEAAQVHTSRASIVGGEVETALPRPKPASWTSLV